MKIMLIGRTNLQFTGRYLRTTIRHAMTTNGILGIIGCLILEDDIVYAVRADKELTEVCVIEDDNSHNLVRKLPEKAPNIRPPHLTG